LFLIQRHRDRLELVGSTLAEWLAYNLAIFLVLFPKGGFKAGSIPLTWGYAIIGIALLCGLPFYLLENSYKFKAESIATFLSLAPFQILLIYSLLVNGSEHWSYALSDVVCFFVLPFAFLGIFPHFLPRIRMDRLLTLTRWLIFLAAAYGIFLFIWRLATGKYIEIPFLTVNIDDVGTLDSKFNSRPDGLFKLISTYNNGNQYGVATLLLFPLYEELEQNSIRKLIVRIALVLTLSRTIWVGMILNELIDILSHVVRDVANTSRLSLRFRTMLRSVRLVLMAGIVLGMTLLFSGISFLFDSSLGGRADYLVTLTHLTWLPSVPVDGFAEIVYFSALFLFGVTGLLAVLLVFTAPLVLFFSFKSLRQSPIQIAAAQGLTLYIFLAAMDGALNYIPTMAFYWFLWMLLLHGASQVRNESLPLYPSRITNEPRLVPAYLGLAHEKRDSE